MKSRYWKLITFLHVSAYLDSEKVACKIIPTECNQLVTLVQI